MFEYDFHPLVRTPRLIGRSEHMEQLKKLFQKNRRGSPCQVVTIQAPGGVGK